MKKYFLIFLILMIGAGTQAKDFMPAYRKQFEEKTKIFRNLVEDMKTGNRRGCPQVKTTDLSSCLRAQIRALPALRNSSELVLLTVAAANAADYDSAHGFESLHVMALNFDNTLSALEKVDVAQLYSAQIPVRSPSDKPRLAFLRYSEEKTLIEGKDKILKDFEKLLLEQKTASDKRQDLISSNSSNRWFAKQIPGLLARVSNLKNKSFRMPTNLVQTKEGEVFQMLKEDNADLCSKPNWKMCSKHKVSKCRSQFTRLISNCEPKNSGVRDLSSAAELDAYGSQVTSCFDNQVAEVRKKMGCF